MKRLLFTSQGTEHIPATIPRSLVLPVQVADRPAVGFEVFPSCPGLLPVEPTVVGDGLVLGRFTSHLANLRLDIDLSLALPVAFTLPFVAVTLNDTLLDRDITSSDIPEQPDKTY